MDKNTKIIIWLVGIIILLCLGLYLYKKSETDRVVTVSPAEISNTSIDGCYVAKLGKDSYTLNIQSKDSSSVSGILAYNNYQKDSSSGTFTGSFTNDILLGNYIFNSEGMQSNRQVVFKKVGNNFVQGFGDVVVEGDTESLKDISTVEYDPKLTFVKSENCVEHFVDTDNTISFDYHAFFSATEVDKTPTLDWRANSKTEGVFIARVVAAGAFLPDTNFAGARLTIGKSADANEIKACSSKTLANATYIGIEGISGNSFNVFTSSEVALGNKYDTKTYRGIVDGDCYVVEYTIHSTNIDNYSPDQEIKEFDKLKIESELQKIIKSINFILSSD